MTETTAPVAPRPKLIDLQVHRELAELRKGPLRADHGTLRGAWAQFHAGAFRSLRVTSQKVYAGVWRRAMSELPPRPTSEEVQNWLVSLETDGGLSRATRSKYHKVMMAVAEHHSVHTDDATLLNVFRRVRRAPQHAKRRRVCDDLAVHLLEHELSITDAERACVRLGAYAGLRVGELLGARPCDVTEFMGQVQLTVAQTRDRFSIRPRKNAGNGKLHIVTLDAVTASLVTALRDQAGSHLVTWSPSYAQHVMERWRKHPVIASQFPSGDAFHVLRHWGATKVAEVTGSVIAVQEWLGDSTPSAAMTYMAQVRGTTRSASAVLIASEVSRRGRGQGPPGAPWLGVTSGTLPTTAGEGSHGVSAPEAASTKFPSPSTFPDPGQGGPSYEID